MHTTLSLAALCLLLPLAVAGAPAVRAVHAWAYWHTPACSPVGGVCVNVWNTRLDVYRATGVMPDAPADDGDAPAR